MYVYIYIYIYTFVFICVFVYEHVVYVCFSPQSWAIAHVHTGTRSWLVFRPRQASASLPIYYTIFHFSICACHPCAGAKPIFSVSFQF